MFLIENLHLSGAPAEPSNTITLPPIFKTPVPHTPSTVREKGKQKGDSERVWAYVREAVDLAETPHQTSEATKSRLVNSYVNNLNTIALEECRKLRKDLENRAGISSNGLYWKDIPHQYRDARVKKVEAISARANINITDCEKSWVGLALLRKHYQNHFNPRKV